MAAQGDGNGGYSITGTTSYQDLFKSADAGGSDGGPVVGYTVRTGADDCYVRVTYANGETRIFNVAAGTEVPVMGSGRMSRITHVEAKGELGGVTIYGNVLIP